MRELLTSFSAGKGEDDDGGTCMAPGVADDSDEAMGVTIRRVRFSFKRGHLLPSLSPPVTGVMPVAAPVSFLVEQGSLQRTGEWGADASAVEEHVMELSVWDFSGQEVRAC